MVYAQLSVETAQMSPIYAQSSAKAAQLFSIQAQSSTKTAQSFSNPRNPLQSKGNESMKMMQSSPRRSRSKVTADAMFTMK
jgi:hypothetical protein